MTRTILDPALVIRHPSSGRPILDGDPESLFCGHCVQRSRRYVFADDRVLCEECAAVYTEWHVGAVIEPVRDAFPCGWGL
jgi:hypothetical protein